MAHMSAPSSKDQATVVGVSNADIDNAAPALNGIQGLRKPAAPFVHANLATAHLFRQIRTCMRLV